MHEDRLRGTGTAMPGGQGRGPRREQGHGTAASNPNPSRSHNRVKTKSLPPAHITLDGREVTLTVKRIKNIYMRIKPPDGHIEISAPADASMGTLAQFMRKQSSWIDKQQQRVREAAAATAQNANQGANAAPVWDEARKREAKAIINAALPGLLAKWTPIVGKAPTNISLRLMRSRWGSCTPKTGRIRLNLALAFMPPRFLEDTLVHELTHLWVLGHGPEFQRRMDAYLPDWRAIRAEKNRDYGATLGYTLV